MSAKHSKVEQEADGAMRRLCEKRLAQGGRFVEVDLDEVARRLGLDPQDWRAHYREPDTPPPA